MAEKKKEQQEMVTVPVTDLATIHNQLCMMHPTGDDIIAAANSIMTLRRLIETSPRLEEPDRADAEEASK